MVVAKENDGVIIEFVAGESIANGIALEVDLVAGLPIQHTHSQRRHIYTSVRLSSYVEFILTELWEL